MSAGWLVIGSGANAAAPTCSAKLVNMQSLHGFGLRIATRNPNVPPCVPLAERILSLSSRTAGKMHGSTLRFTKGPVTFSHLAARLRVKRKNRYETGY